MGKKPGDGIKFDYNFEIELDDLGFPKNIKISDAKADEAEAINSNISTAMEGLVSLKQASHKQVGESLAEARNSAPSPMFSIVVSGFLDSYPHENKSSMYKKHLLVLGMLLEVVGDKPITELRQADINGFFALLERLPPRWADECRLRKLTIRQLAAIDHKKTLGPNSFENTYMASVRPFLKAARRDWQDQGFPTTLTTEAIEYRGDRVEGENKQRAFKETELKRLFEGPEIQGFSLNPKVVQRFWLPVLALYSGARVNELCQLNPQTDVYEDASSGIWCLNMTEETESHDGIKKSIKTGEARVIPVHRHLIDLGFPEYVSAIKKSGAKQLFPLWKPQAGRAAPKAMKWFSRFLADIGLHGVENENRLALRGMHAFRHTLLPYGKLAGMNLRCISGHAEETDNRVAEGYEDDTILQTLAAKQTLLDQLDYGLVIPKPVLPQF